MNTIVEIPSMASANLLKQITVDFDRETSTLYWWMTPSPRPCFNPAFLEESKQFEGRIEQHHGWFIHEGKECRIENAVFGSRVPGVFNLGGDLSMFVQAILRKDRETLTYYGHLCVDNMYRRMVGYNAQVMTYSLVQGRAFGGGFECALASEVIIAEKSATMSFPEVLFNMFPGMGALSLLARRIGPRKAEDIIMSGRVYSAREMYDLGVVDQVAEDGAGLETTRLMIKSRQRRRNSYRAMAEAKREVLPVNHSEMSAVVDIWVNAALALETRDLRMMARLARAQDKLASYSEEDTAVAGLYDNLPEVANA
jgi:DSF synthase